MFKEAVFSGHGVVATKYRNLETRDRGLGVTQGH